MGNEKNPLLEILEMTAPGTALGADIITKTARLKIQSRCFDIYNQYIII